MLLAEMRGVATPLELVLASSTEASADRSDGRGTTLRLPSSSSASHQAQGRIMVRDCTHQ